MYTDLMIRSQWPHVINTGIAGLLNPELQVGILLSPQIWIQHDMNVGPLNFAAGQIQVFRFSRFSR